MRLSIEDLATYQEALKDRVCSVCSGSGYAGVCKVGDRGVCPIDLYLAEIVTAVLSTPRSEHIADYLPAIRKRVCSLCVNQDERGVCMARELATCGLDSLLLLVVETIEDVADREGHVRRGRVRAGKTESRRYHHVG